MFNVVVVSVGAGVCRRTLFTSIPHIFNLYHDNMRSTSQGLGGWIADMSPLLSSAIANRLFHRVFWTVSRL
jgi:hypothetical protein